MSLDIGKRLGSYEITGLIGAAGMGEGYRATDTRLGRTRRCGQRSRLLKRVFGIEIGQCVRSGGWLKVIASTEEPEVIERIL